MAYVKLRRSTLPLIAVRGLVVFPYMILHFDVARPRSIRALEAAMADNQLVFLLAQKDASVENPKKEDLYEIGTVAKVKQLLKLPGENIRVLVEGLYRAEIKEFIDSGTYFEADITEKRATGKAVSPIEFEAIKRQAKELFDGYSELNSKISPEALANMLEIKEPSEFADVVASNVVFKTEDKQEILSELNVSRRLEKLITIMANELEIIRAENNILSRVRRQMDKNQRDYFLREQIKAIKTELGENDGIEEEVEEYRERLDELNLPENVRGRIEKELDRLSKMTMMSAESTVVRNYIDTLMELPWSVKTEENYDIKKAREYLDEDHYGLEAVKERIIELLSVGALKNSMKGPILCLAGPPGVGKTSIAKAIAKATNRKYVRMSLGGVRDEAEIRGHRKTYVGAMPGRIINALRQAGSSNALILLDEIDKMSSDYRGDPASAMLEVLDSEQNFAFRDHYVEIPFDLSNVMFITTANDVSNIPRPLLDRMEVITLSSYTEDEKLNIALLHLLPKQLEAHGLKSSQLRIDEDAMREIINCYTKESGVRNLERQIASLCRKAAKLIASGEKKRVNITKSSLSKYLGPKKFRYEAAKDKDEIGVATGLAWTSVGGDTLSIEVNVMEGTGKIELTGHLGDIMKESAMAALSYIRSRAGELKLDKNFYKDSDIHIHVPEGATPKDGPSAGITIATALASALTGRPVRKDVAMTGEITIRGRVLPVGGIKEKLLAAYRIGITNIIMPLENKTDIEEIPKEIRDKMQFVFASEMDTVLKYALISDESELGFLPYSSAAESKSAAKEAYNEYS